MNLKFFGLFVYFRGHCCRTLKRHVHFCSVVVSCFEECTAQHKCPQYVPAVHIYICLSGYQNNTSNTSILLCVWPEGHCVQTVSPRRISQAYSESAAHRRFGINSSVQSNLTCAFVGDACLVTHFRVSQPLQMYILSAASSLSMLNSLPAPTIPTLSLETLP